MHIEQRISPGDILPSESILAFETEWIRIAQLLQSSAASFSIYRKIMNH
jgi:hypothetical protein